MERSPGCESERLDTGHNMQGEPAPTVAAPAAQEAVAGSGHAPCTAGIKLFPRILGGIRKEELSTSLLHKLSNDKQLADKTDISADHLDKKPLGISVSLQTEESWLYEHSSRKMVQDYLKGTTPLISKKQQSCCSESSEDDVYSDLIEDLSDLSILHDMKLNEDFLKFFEEPMQTLPSVGPPTILAYKPESSEKDRDYSKIQMLVECSVSAVCELCGKLLKPLPLNYLLSLEDPKQFFCCKEFQNLFESLFHEQKHLLQEDDIAMISIAPHPPHGSELERQRAKEKTAQRLRERQMAKYYASMATTATEPTGLPEYGKQFKTISYQLSDAPPSGVNWTVVPKLSVEEKDMDDLNNITCDFTVACEKLMPRQFFERYYKHGLEIQFHWWRSLEDPEWS